MNTLINNNNNIHTAYLIRINRSSRRKLRDIVHQKVKKFYYGKKFNCIICHENKNIQFHHEDYSKPLDIIPLCPKHHLERQKIIRNENLDPYRNTVYHSIYLNGFWDWRY
jgi:hypothetical protein